MKTFDETESRHSSWNRVAVLRVASALKYNIIIRGER